MIESNTDLQKYIQWIARADFHNETPRFGSVRHQYRKKFLTGVQLGPELEYYFKKCVPTSTFEGNTHACWCYFKSSRGLWYTAHNYSYSKVLARCGFLIIATDQGGNPLFVDPMDGRIFSFQSGYLYDDELNRPAQKEGWIRVPATRETVREWSQFSWDSLYSFFDDVEQATREWHRNRLVPCIARRELPDLIHYQTLGLGIVPEQVWSCLRMDAFHGGCNIEHPEGSDGPPRRDSDPVVPM